MSLWFVYRNYSSDASIHADVPGFGPVDLKANFTDLQVFKAGALINF